MINTPSLKFITTQRINKVLIEICENKKINLQELIRQVYQFLMVLDNYYAGKNINVVLIDIFKEYDDYEYKPLNTLFQQIKTYVTKRQHEAYNKIERKNRILFFNKLISIVINNINYTNFKFEETIKKNSIINKFTINYFINKSNDSEIILWLMESLLAKHDYVLNHSYISDTFFKKMYISLFGDEESKDFIAKYNVAKFLQKEFQKIYFCMLHTYKVKMNTKATKGNARKVYKLYNDKYKNIYNQDIELFITNEIKLYNGLSEIEQMNEFLQYISATHPSKKEQALVAASIYHIITSP